MQVEIYKGVGIEFHETHYFKYRTDVAIYGKTIQEVKKEIDFLKDKPTQKKLVKNAKAYAKKGDLQFVTNPILNGFGGLQNGQDAIVYQGGRVKYRQTCYNCGDGHTIDLTELLIK